MNFYTFTCYETVSRQMPWVGNIAKTMTSNEKQFTVSREMLTAVARDQRWPDVVAKIWARFSKIRFCFVLLYNNSLNGGSPRDKSLNVKCFTTFQNTQEKKAKNKRHSGVFLMNFEIPGNVVNTVLSVWYIFSIETKTKEKREKYRRKSLW